MINHFLLLPRFNFYFLFALISICPKIIAEISFGSFSNRSYTTQNSYGSEYYSDVAVDEDGSIFVVGGSNGPLQGNWFSNREKAMVHKRSAGGELIWEYVYEQSNEDYSANRVQILDDSSILVAIKNSSYSGFSKHFNTKLLRISKNGQLIWEKNIEPNYYIIKSNRNGRYAMVQKGNSNSSTDVALYNESGVQLWSIQAPLTIFGSIYNTDYYSEFDYRNIADIFTPMVFSPEGSLIVGGITNMPNSTSLPLVVGYSPSGSKIFETFLPNNYAERILSLCVDDSGGIYSVNRIDLGESLVINKINSTNGTIAWVRKLNASSIKVGCAVVDGFITVFMNDSFFDTESYYLAVLSQDGIARSVVPSNLGLLSRRSFAIGPNGHFASVGYVDSNGGDAIIALSTLKGPPSRILEISGSLLFGEIESGYKEILSITIKNTGNSPLTIFSISMPQILSADWTSGTISPGTSKQIDFSFRPNTSGTVAGTISISSDATNGASQIPFRGTGVGVFPDPTPAPVAPPPVGGAAPAGGGGSPQAQKPKKGGSKNKSSGSAKKSSGKKTSEGKKSGKKKSGGKKKNG